jgi:hypothetical protein
MRESSQREPEEKERAGWISQEASCRDSASTDRQGGRICSEHIEGYFVRRAAEHAQCGGARGAWKAEGSQSESADNGV